MLWLDLNAPLIFGMYQVMKVSHHVWQNVFVVFGPQARVFGAGYPSLPTMTVDDWYEQHQKHGALPDQGIPRRVAPESDTDAKDREEEEKEEKVEQDDEESLMKARNWDDWKDNHRRGYGNRHNMGWLTPQVCPSHQTSSVFVFTPVMPRGIT